MSQTGGISPLSAFEPTVTSMPRSVRAARLLPTSLASSMVYRQSQSCQMEGSSPRARHLTTTLPVILPLRDTMLTGALTPRLVSDGRVTTAISDCGPGGNSQDRLFAIAIQMDGKMVAGGFTVFCGPFAFALARYNVDGSLDPAFGLEGKITTAFSGECILRAIALQPNGKIVAAGYASCCSFTEFALARYKTDGSLDSTFGTGGKVTTSFLDGSGEAHGIALQADGKIIAAGRALDFNTFGFKFALSRYMGDPSFDLCLQDDSNGNLLQFNSTTGDYLFTDCRKGITLRGTGAVTNDPYGCKITLQDAGPNTKRPDRSVLVQVNRCTHAARASIQIFSTGSSFSITDSDITNNTFACR
jgi:uncharacterized delta-60 repeat protein